MTETIDLFGSRDTEATLVADWDLLTSSLLFLQNDGISIETFLDDRAIDIYRSHEPPHGIDELCEQVELLLKSFKRMMQVNVSMPYGFMAEFDKIERDVIKCRGAR